MLKLNSRIPRLWLRINKIEFGNNLKLIGYPFLFRFSGAKIIIGNNASINSSFLSNLLGLYQRTIIVARNKAIISIGDNVGISGATIYAIDNIEIGNDCLIGANTKIVDNDFHSLNPEERKNSVGGYCKPACQNW